MQRKASFIIFQPLYVSFPVTAFFDCLIVKLPIDVGIEAIYLTTKADQSNFGASPCYYVALDWAEYRKVGVDTCAEECNSQKFSQKKRK